jgi:hypothetical protein
MGRASGPTVHDVQIRTGCRILGLSPVHTHTHIQTHKRPVVHPQPSPAAADKHGAERTAKASCVRSWSMGVSSSCPGSACTLRCAACRSGRAAAVRSTARQSPRGGQAYRACRRLGHAKVDGAAAVSARIQVQPLGRRYSQDAGTVGGGAGLPCRCRSTHGARREPRALGLALNHPVGHRRRIACSGSTRCEDRSGRSASMVATYRARPARRHARSAALSRPGRHRGHVWPPPSSSPLFLFLPLCLSRSVSYTAPTTAWWAQGAYVQSPRLQRQQQRQRPRPAGPGPGRLRPQRPPRVAAPPAR